MSIANYIKDLLYRYDCVIVPNFGGFVTNRVSAKIHPNTHTFYPPSKQVGFNSNLTHNDGLLANYIASSENISFNEANSKISDIVSDWNSSINLKPLKIDELGSFSLNDKNQLIFSPCNKVNYLNSSFGLAYVKSYMVERTNRKVIPFVPVKEGPKKTPIFLKYAATALLLLGLTYVGRMGYENKQEEVNFAKNQKKLEQKIQSATFIIKNPLPTIELNVDKALPKTYHVIAGSFQFPENAHRKVSQLNANGFQAFILGKNKWGLTQVAYASFHKKTDAYQSLASVRKIDSKDAWLLVKKFE